MSLTTGERFLIDRKRKNMGQEEYSKKFLDMTRNQYGRVERGMDENSDIGISQLSPLSDIEICFIKRKRSGKSQAQCAAEMKVTRFWYNQMESNRVDSKALIDFWG